jgi:hypothetical protein
MGLAVRGGRCHDQANDPQEGEGPMLHITALIAVSVIVVLYAVAGVMALTTGRVVPWAQGRVVRPELWGCGALLFAAGMALCRFRASVRDLTAADVVFPVGMALLLGGGVLQILGGRPGRTPEAAVRKNVS